jgi:N-acetylmuramoyl-L-alanine amidase
MSRCAKQSRRVIVALVAVGAVAGAAACGTSSKAAAPTSTSSIPSSTTAPPTTSSAATSRRVTPTTHPKPRPTPTSRPAPSTHKAPPPSSGGPVIVLDPGHSVSISATHPATGLNVSDYENEPEMRDVFAVAELVRSKLQAAGYRVVMTKATVDTPASLLKRAQIADNVHAALALSIHDQAGSNGGIPFAEGNNIVYYQSVGTYRATSSGKKYYFTDQKLAGVSARYGQIFQDQRARVEGHQIRLQGDTGYDLGGRGLAGGNIWMVQLLSHVPWIYNEAGGNSAGMAGLNATDKQRYADGLVTGVEHCVPVN